MPAYACSSSKNSSGARVGSTPSRISRWRLNQARSSAVRFTNAGVGPAGADWALPAAGVTSSSRRIRAQTQREAFAQRLPAGIMGREETVGSISSALFRSG